MKRYELLLLVAGFIGASYVGSAKAESFACERVYASNNASEVINMNVKTLAGGEAILVQRQGFEPFILHHVEKSGNPFIYVDSDKNEWFVSADQMSVDFGGISDNCYKVN